MPMMWGTKATSTLAKTRLTPDFCSPATKLGPALKPTIPMKTLNPTVSKGRINGSVGYPLDVIPLDFSPIQIRLWSYYKQNP